jgi:hypothetical protein
MAVLDENLRKTLTTLQLVVKKLKEWKQRGYISSFLLTSKMKKNVNNLFNYKAK